MGLKTEWDLSPLLAGDDDPKRFEERKRIEEKSKAFFDKWNAREDYLDNPGVMKEALDDYEEFLGKYGVYGKEGFYYSLRSWQDLGNADVKAKYNNVLEFGKRIEDNIRFFRLKIAGIDVEKQKEFLKSQDLVKYKHYLKRVFAEAKHILSEKEERIMSLKSEVCFDNWLKMIAGLLANEERKVLDNDGKLKKKHFSEISALINNKDKKIRDKAAEAFNDILAGNIDMVENAYNSVLQNKKINDELRKFDRADSSRHLADDLDSEIVDVLINAVMSRADIAKRYYALKAKLFGVHKIAYHERNVPYGSVNKEFKYEESVKLIEKVFNNLDPEFTKIFHSFLKGRIDVYPKKGKKDGAFCTDAIASLPVYIMINHANQLDDVCTLAHELGHGIHHELMRKQISLYVESNLATAEVASTFMEDFVLRELMKNVSDEEKLSLMMSKLNDDISTIFRQASAYAFETEIHNAFRKKGYLSKQEIGQIFMKHMDNYMGDAVEKSKGCENWWIYWPHIKGDPAFFYVYSYSSGLLISKALQGNVSNDKVFIGKVKEFMSAGASQSPRDIFLKLGIDISKKEFWDSGLDEVEKLLLETEDLAKKLGKI